MKNPTRYVKEILTYNSVFVFHLLHWDAKKQKSYGAEQVVESQLLYLHEEPEDPDLSLSSELSASFTLGNLNL